jgi:cardiolipin synthase
MPCSRGWRKRAREGIKVRVLLDGFGALSLPRHHFDRLRAAGGEVAVFRPFFSLRRIGPRNLRNHRKFTIADDSWLWSGGRNLAGEYFTGNDKHPEAWHDLSFDLHGSVAAAAARQFDHDWASVRSRKARAITATTCPKDRARPWRSSCRAAPTRPKTPRTRC